MSMEQLLFYILAALVVFGGVKFLTAKETMHAVLHFFLALMATAGLFFLLSAPFVAAMQILIYGGALTVLIIFVVMLTAVEQPSIEALRANPLNSLAVSISFLAFLLMGALYEKWPKAVTPIEESKGTPDLARVLFREYVIPFEVVSIVLLAALIGAIYIAMVEREN